MANAAAHHPLQREDFLRMAAAEHRAHAHHGGSSLRPPPTLPSVADVDNDEDMFPTLTLLQAAGGNQATTTNQFNNTATTTATAASTATAAGAAVTGGGNTNNTNNVNASFLMSNTDDPTRIQPINIAMLKEHLAKKVLGAKAGTNNSNNSVANNNVSINTGGNTVLSGPGSGVGNKTRMGGVSSPVGGGLGPLASTTLDSLDSQSSSTIVAKTKKPFASDA